MSSSAVYVESASQAAIARGSGADLYTKRAARTAVWKIGRFDAEGTLLARFQASAVGGGD